ncbi:MAG: DUF669 domain-containing protein [Synergistaceae bacterium]|nr:DUF669 domain-containing protein [Synergistaceae bacterium]MBR0076134.1 DUF669 domain-containing protein [Synergistaceae bacterium]MBR0080080.1 DUF669 domain-containing protein [Synergistaceae bacterium]
MINWTFNPKDYVENALIKPGEYRVRIDDAEETTSKSNRQMIKMTLAISGYNIKIFHYVVFLQEYPEITNNNLGQIFESFGITPNDFVMDHWKGKVGGAKIDNELNKQTEQMQNVIKRFLKPAKTNGLPAWVEGKVKTEGTINYDMINFDEQNVSNTPQAPF